MHHFVSAVWLVESIYNSNSTIIFDSDIPDENVLETTSWICIFCCDHSRLYTLTDYEVNYLLYWSWRKIDCVKSPNTDLHTLDLSLKVILLVYNIKLSQGGKPTASWLNYSRHIAIIKNGGVYLRGLFPFV